MLDTLISLDSDALLWLNSFHTPLLDRFVMLFTGRFVWIPMYAAILYAVWRTFSLRQTAIIVLCIAAAIALSDQTVASILRPIFQRMRPANLDNPLSEFVTVVDGYRGGRYGFPSCHGANSFALAVFVALLFRRPRLTVFIFVWAVCNCLTRNYLGVHYPGDIIVGAAIGSVFGWLCCIAARRIGHISVVGHNKSVNDRVAPTDVVIWVGVATAVVLLAIAVSQANCA